MSGGSRNLRAAALTVAAVGTFCVNDAVVKLLTARLPPGQILALRGLFVMALLLLVLPRLGLRPGRPDRFALTRAAAEVGVNGCFVAGLLFLPLGDSYTLYFTAPIMLTAAAALFLGERVGWQRWAAVAAGFLGVLLAVGTPGSWHPAVLLPLLAAALSVVRDLATQRVPPAVGAGTVALTTAVAVTLAGLATIPFAWTTPGPTDLGLCLAAALGASCGYVLFVVALRTGELSFISPFRYAGIPMAMLLGLLVWGEAPSARMLLGAVVVVGAGLFVLQRERGPLERPKP